MSRVLATQEAKTAIQQLKSIISGGLTDELTSADAQGQILCDPNVWDGPLAEKFRSTTWPEASAALKKVVEELLELNQQTDTISSNIFSAGGGA